MRMKQKGAFEEALAALAARRRRAAVRGALSVVLASLLALFALLHLLYTIFYGWPPLPLVSFVLFWAGAAWAVRRAARDWSVWRSERLASELDGMLGLKGLLGAALEFGHGGKRVERYSGFMRGETVRRAAETLRTTDGGRLFGGLNRPGWGVAGICFAIVLLLQITVTGGREAEIVRAVTDPTIYLSRRAGTNLVVTSGDRSVIAGGRVVCEAVNFGSPAGGIDLRISRAPGVWKRIELEPERAEFHDAEMSVYRHRFEDVQESFRYRFETAGRRTEEHRVTVIRRPVINAVSAIISFPSYTETAAETIGTLAGKIYATSGSRIELVGETSKPVAEGWIDFGGAPDVPLVPLPGGFSGSFTVTGDDTFTLGVIDTVGLGNEEAIRYPVVSLADAPPSVEIIDPRDGDYLPLSLEVQLRYEASDDFGLSAVRLQYLREGKDERFRRMELPLDEETTVKEIETVFTWSLNGVSLFPGDALLYYLEAVDNNTVTGPSVTRTESRRLVLPTLGELYERISEQEEARREGLDRIQEESKEIRLDLKRLLAEYKAQGEFDWSRRREAEELIERHEELMRQIGDAGDQLGETLAELERNRATSQEIGEKLAEIRDMLERIESERLRDAIERFQERLGEVSPDELLPAMRELDMDMEDLARRLERTAELLKRIMRDERLEELIRRMESMLAEQRDIRDSEEAPKELADRQEDLRGRMQELDRDLGSFEEDTGGPSPGLKEMLEEFDMEELTGAMKQAAEELERDDRNAAAKTQNEALEQMIALYTSLARLQFDMGMQMSAETMQMVTRAARRLIEISKQQEEARDEFLVPGERAGQAERQLVIRDAIRSVRDRLYETSRGTMAVSLRVFMHIGRALSEAEGVMGNLEGRSGGGAAAGAERVYESLNLAAVELLRISSALGSGRGEGAQGAMQSLLQGQSSIDDALRGMLGSGGESWSVEERARMARLAAEQRRLEELLEEIEREASGEHRPLGRLDDLEEEMEGIAQRLEEGELDHELLEREERILSRLLESQRSLARRDYEERRTSRPGEDLMAADAEAAAVGGEDTRIILEMIRNGMREKGPVEYEELIRRYFRALARKVRSKE